MSGAERSCGGCEGCSKKKNADEPKTKHQRKKEEKPNLCKSCHEEINEKPELCKSCKSSRKKEKESLTRKEKFIADHECEPAPKVTINSSVCRDIHCKDHNKKPIVKPSTIESALPQMMPPLPSPIFYPQGPPFYHPNRPMYHPQPLPPPPPPHFSTYDRSMQQYRSPYGGGYREFW